VVVLVRDGVVEHHDLVRDLRVHVEPREEEREREGTLVVLA
jgi:hypothetical protein